MSTSISPYEWLDRILRGGEGENIRSYDQDIRSREPSEISLILTSQSSHMAYVGPLITTTDREFRRAVSIFRSDSYYLGEPGRRPRPISQNYGGLEITDVAFGSVHMLLTAYGEVLSLLTSRPLQALTAVLTVGQSAGTIRLWRQRKRDSLAGMSARQALDVLKEFNGDPAGLMQGKGPDLEIEIQPTPDERQPFTDPGQPESNLHIYIQNTIPVVKVNQVGEIILTDRQITIIRRYPNGTYDIIYVYG
jgi:hypothetical protein